MTTDDIPTRGRAGAKPASKPNQQTELIILALTASREALWMASNALSTFGATAFLGAEIKKQIGLIDYVTSTLAPEVGWTVNTAGTGAEVDAGLRKKAETWVARGKQFSDLNR